MKREEILQYTGDDINNMSEDELYRLGKAIQKNIKDSLYRLKKENLSTPARKQIEKSGNISITKKMNQGVLKREVAKGLTMVRYKTGTVSGAREVEANMKQGLLNRLQGRLDVSDITEDESKTMWDIIKRLGESPDTRNLLDTTELKYIPKETQQRVYQIMKVANAEDDPDKLYSISKGLLDNVYKGESFNDEIERLREAVNEGTEMQLYEVD